MITPGLIVLLAALAVGAQIGVAIWIRRDVRAVEERMFLRIDALAGLVKQLSEKDTALVQRCDELIRLQGQIVMRHDEAQLRS